VIAKTNPTAAVPVIEAATPTTPIDVVATGITIAQVRESWQRILDEVAKKSKRAYMVAYAIDVMAVEGDVLTLRFASNYDLENFKGEVGAPDILRKAIENEFGVVFKFKPLMEVKAEAPVTASSPVVAVEPEPEVVSEPDKKAAPESRNTKVDEEARYGESLLREILGAEPLDD